MADENLIDIPDLETMSQNIEDTLESNNFIIKNFRNGRIFKTLLMAFLQGIVTLYELLVTVVLKVFILGATGSWLDMKAMEFGIARKVATKTEGKLTLSRSEAGKAIKIPKGSIFKTSLSTEGIELRYVSVDEVVMDFDALDVEVEVVAELEGTAYNIPSGMITQMFKNISGIETVTNASDWLLKEGTDEESDDALRTRCLAVWDLLATNMTVGAYEAAILDVNGVAVVNIDDEHPRGQGTIDIVVAGVAGAPTTELLTEVQTVIDDVKGPYDDVSLIGATAVPQDVTVTIYKDDNYGDAAEIQSDAEQAISELFIISSDNQGNRLYLSDINYSCRVDEYVKNVKVTVPSADVLLQAAEIITPGTITVSVVNVGDA